MPQIDGMRARLETAGELTGLLTAAWDAFSLLLAACWDCEERAGELFAAFAFASAAAGHLRTGADHGGVPDREPAGPLTARLAAAATALAATCCAAMPPPAPTAGGRRAPAGPR